MSDSGKRRFIVHAPHTVIGISGGTPMVDPLADLLEVAKERVPGRFVLLSGAPRSQSDNLLQGMLDCLSHRFQAECRWALGGEDESPCGLADLFEADCLILFAEGLTLGEPMRERVRQYCQHGGSLVVIGAAGHTFSDWPEFDASVVGIAKDVSGSENVESRVIRVPGVLPHPILKGVHSFSADDRGRPLVFASGCTPLLGCVATEGLAPVAWVRQYRGARVFCTSLGTPADFQQPSFIRLLLNATDWAAGRDENSLRS